MPVKRELPDAVKQALREWSEKLTNWICPTCNSSIDKQVQSGRCVYASPCGCRLFQGKAQKKPRNVSDGPKEQCGCEEGYVCVKHR